MRLYEVNRRNHKQRKYRPERAVMQTICNKGEFYLAGLISVVFTLSPLIYIMIIAFKDIEGDPGIMIGTLLLTFAFAIGYFLSIYALNGHSIGLRLLGLRHVRIRGAQLMDKEMFIDTLGERIWNSFRYNNTYESWSTLFSETNQSPTMRKMGMIIVKYRVFKLFLEDYTVNGVVVRPEKDDFNSPILSESHDQIFQDE